MELRKYAVPVEKLRWKCDPKMFDFECTKDLAPLRDFIGQERATRAVEFGLNMADKGYNIYVAGLTGTGKTSMVKAYIERVIKEREARGETFVMDDWCYLYNFKEPDSPRIVHLPQGKGKALRNEISDLLGKIRQELGQAFSSEEYKNQRQKTIEEGQTAQQKLFEEIADEARRQGFILQMTAAGPLLIPMKENRPMQEEEYLALGEEERREIEEKQTSLRKKLHASFEAVGELHREVAERLQKIDKNIGEYTVSRLFSPLVERYSEWPKVSQYLDDLEAYILNNLEPFKGTEEPVHPVFGIPAGEKQADGTYAEGSVNYLVDQRLREMAERLRGFYAEEKKAEK